ncbi:MAG: PA0069 family radical SAM protein [Pseudomonadota bacterium]
MSESEIPSLLPEIDPNARRGRGATSNVAGRFEPYTSARVDDGWEAQDENPFKTEVFIDRSRRAITRNTSPDVPFDRSINPYKGCEHGCVYCFARPTHEYLGLSPGLDFETKLFAKPDVAAQLQKELRRPGYTPDVMAIGTNTDPYQPIEKQHALMRAVLEVLEAYKHPVSIVTKGGLVTRDTDILGRMGKRGLAQVAISITTLDTKLSRRLEPRCAAPQVRFRAIKALSEAGVRTGVLIAPIIPALNDHEIEPILAAAKRAGASFAHFVPLRLPGAVAPLFRDWLKEHYPDRAHRVMRYVREIHGGKDYDPEWGKRMRGQGVYANLIARRFKVASARVGLTHRTYDLDCSQFAPPPRAGDQMQLL